ncbi:MAG TPA: DUF4381 domain-containing protein [Steroidobacteraceae bacterium]|nr:DUF4381 domain-containing protein [Steroidobacteraceae bacterium]
MSTDLLAQLAPEHAPAPPGWFPPAPGWWIAAALSALALLALWRWLSDPRHRPRRAALRELRALRRRPLSDGALAASLENLLRRYAIALFGRAGVARLTGQAWLDFLAERGAPALRAEAGRSLIGCAFAGCGAGDRDRWLAAVHEFIGRAARVAPRR